MLDLAHALDDLVEAVLQVQEEAVPALRQGSHQTCNAQGRRLLLVFFFRGVTMKLRKSLQLIK